MSDKRKEPWSEERRARHVERMRALWADPKTREAHSDSMRAANTGKPLALPPLPIDSRLDLGPVPAALHDDVLAEPPQFDFGEAA